MTSSDNFREEWLAATDEPILEPERVIVDPHHHLWGTERSPGPYLAAELAADVRSGHRVVETVYVQARSAYRVDGPPVLRPVGETEFIVQQNRELQQLTGGNVRIGAMVAYADLQLGDAVDAVLDAHEAAGNGLVRGLRNTAAWDPSPEIANSSPDTISDLYSDDRFRAGFARLAKRGWSYDAWSFHHQIPSVTRLARAFPDTTIVLDHYGGPVGLGPYVGKREEILAQWRIDISALARCPNVVVKLGGMAMPVNGFAWHKREAPPSSEALAASQRPYFEHTITEFGPERCMLESNFPVDKASTSYKILWNALKRLAADMSEDEKVMLFSATASRVYGLERGRPGVITE